MICRRTSLREIHKSVCPVCKVKDVSGLGGGVGVVREYLGGGVVSIAIRFIHLCHGFSPVSVTVLSLACYPLSSPVRR